MTIVLASYKEDHCIRQQCSARRCRCLEDVSLGNNSTFLIRHEKPDVEDITRRERHVTDSKERHGRNNRHVASRLAEER